MTHDLLDELVRDVPRHVIPDIDGAWRAGAVRRRRWLLVRATVAAALVAAVVSAVLGFDGRQSVMPANGEQTVGSHPSFVPRPFLADDLPARPGPMAGVLNTGDDVLAVVDEDGRSWRLPGFSGTDYVPSLSDDGRLLGYMEMLDAGKSQFVILDLVTGKRVEFPEIGDNVGDSGQLHTMIGQGPSYWSPDGRWLLVDGYVSDSVADGDERLLIRADGEVRSLPSRGHAVGWIGEDRLGWLPGPDRLVVTDLDGVVLDRVGLDAVPRDLPAWSGRLSPDGSKLAMMPTGRDAGVVMVFDVTTGRMIHQGIRSAGELTDLMWVAGYEPMSISPTGIAGVTGRGLVDTSSGSYVIEYSSHWPAMPGVWASDALMGEESSAPGLRFEWRYWGFLWWWRQILAGTAALTALAAVFLVRRSRRHRPQSTAPETVDRGHRGEPA